MKIIQYYLLLPLFFFCIKVEAQQLDDDHDYDTFQLQKKMILGNFLNEDNNWELAFTKDGKCHERFVITTDSEQCDYSYSIMFSTRPNTHVPAGYENVYILHLKPLFPSDSCESDTYEMYVNDKVLDLYPTDRYGAFLFYRVKTKKPAAAAPKKEEVKPVEKKKMAAEAHFVGTYDCLERNEYGHSLKDPTYEKDYSIGWEQAGCMAP